MRNTIYVKYDSWRKPEFRIRTSFEKGDGKTYVVKKAMGKPTESHIATIRANYEKVKDLYQNIQVIPYEPEDGTEDRVTFPFIEGEEFPNADDYYHMDLRDLREKLNQSLDRILDFRPEYVTDFQMTDEFRAFFPDCEPEKQPAVTVGNVDGIFSNFILSGGELCCLDYEWVLDFPIPVGFIKYRALHYLYHAKNEIKDRMSEDEFLEIMEIKTPEIKLFNRMETCFIAYTHGEKEHYKYGRNYLKKAVPLKTVEEWKTQNEDHRRQTEELRHQADLYRDLADKKEELIIRQEQELNRIYHSFSWKITKPLRGVLRLFKR